LSGLELFDNAFALGLSHFAVESSGAMAVLREQLCERFCGSAELHEDDGSVVGFGFEQSQERCFLLIGCCNHISLSDRLSSCCTLLNFDIHGISQLLLRDLSYTFRHGC
jgi:hypothetical protein